MTVFLPETLAPFILMGIDDYQFVSLIRSSDRSLGNQNSDLVFDDLILILAFDLNCTISKYRPIRHIGPQSTFLTISRLIELSTY